MKVMIMAGGTGGHVFPALAVAEQLRLQGHEVRWMGAPNSFEASKVPAAGIAMDYVQITGLRGKGALALLAAPIRLLKAVAQAFAILRREQPNCVGESFGTISAYGPHAALPHYSSTPESDVELRPEGLYLLDSGGQYLGGTTDTTRVIALGPVNANPYPPGVPQLSEAVTTCIDAEIGDRTSREVIVDAGKDCLRSEWAAGPAMGRCQTELAANTEMWNAALVGPVAVGKLAGQFTIDNCASALGGF